LPLARLYQLWLRQPLTIPHQNPHRPVRKILVVGQIYRYTFDVAVAMPMRAVVIDGEVEGFTHELPRRAAWPQSSVEKPAVRNYGRSNESNCQLNYLSRDPPSRR
jgi:hypothetical protein